MSENRPDSGSVTTELLADGSVNAEKLENGSVTEAKLADGAVSGRAVADGSIGGAKLADGSVSGDKLALGSVTGAHLGFAAIAAGVAGATMLFGSEAYSFGGAVESIEVIVVFAEPFKDNSYVLVAMTDHPSCTCYLKRKSPNEAVLEVLRTRLSPEPQGWLQWIAAGTR